MKYIVLYLVWLALRASTILAFGLVVLYIIALEFHVCVGGYTVGFLLSCLNSGHGAVTY